MITLGVDPGTNTTGYGLVSGDVSRMELVDFGAVKTKPKAPLALRLEQVYEGISQVIGRLKPDQVALEEAFFAKDAKSALKLGMARGVIMLAAQKAGLPVFEYSPLLIKQTVTGYGRADKEQVREMVRIQLSMKKPPSPIDASDALATAITHIIHREGPLGRALASR